MQSALRFIRYVAVTLILLSSPAAWATRIIEAWSYYPAPPFQVGPLSSSGLCADLVSYLNKALAGKYEIRYTLLPRARLQKMLDDGDKAFVMFVPSAIFGGPDGGAYLWTSPFFVDRQELISRTSLPFEFTGPDSLVGKRFAAMHGHVYPMIAKEMEAGQIRADRATTESSLISMLIAKHVDVITIPTSTARYFMTLDPRLKQEFSFSVQSLGTYTRHLMFQRGMEKERDDFEKVVKEMSTDPKWIATLKKYGLEPSRPRRGSTPTSGDGKSEPTLSGKSTRR